jgi:hypothetical protein
MTNPAPPTPDELREAAQLADAELSVLTMYDDARRAFGYDFGNGQRYAELIRLRRERDLAAAQAAAYGVGALADVSATPQQQRAAFERISRQRLARYSAEAHTGRTEQLARRAWSVVEKEIAYIERKVAR